MKLTHTQHKNTRSTKQCITT